jgi:hypothetical protein
VGASSGTKAYFGASDSSFSTNLFIYDSVANSWSLSALPFTGRNGMSALAFGKPATFFSLDEFFLPVSDVSFSASRPPAF